MPHAGPVEARSPLLAIVGPTGSGKSDLALILASEFAGEIVNFDSVQLYRGFDIGSAKIAGQHRRGVPHHLLDISEAGAEVSAGEYARIAAEVIREISNRGKLPVLVGGSGFYLRALLDGLPLAPSGQPGLRNRLRVAEQRRPGLLHRFLRRFDPIAERRIHPNDLRKLSRAVEMTLAADRPASELTIEKSTGLPGHRVLKLGLQPARDLLRDRLNQRAASMFADGLLDETQGLLTQGVRPDSQPMASLGYKQAVAFLEGRTTLEDAIAECQTRTRQYAKRQMTWFRAEKDVCWLNGFGTDDAVVEQALAVTRQWLLG